MTPTHYLTPAQAERRESLYDLSDTFRQLAAKAHAAGDDAHADRLTDLAQRAYKLAVEVGDDAPDAAGLPVAAPTPPPAPPIPSSIRYDRTTKDLAITVAGQLIGYAGTYIEAEARKQAHIYGQLVPGLRADLSPEQAESLVALPAAA